MVVVEMRFSPEIIVLEAVEAVTPHSSHTAGKEWAMRPNLPATKLHSPS
jgi:hypothetical protein